MARPTSSRSMSLRWVGALSRTPLPIPSPQPPPPIHPIPSHPSQYIIIPTPLPHNTSNHHQGFLLYPAQLVIPMVEEIDLERLRNPAPIGILMLTVLSVRACVACVSMGWGGYERGAMAPSLSALTHSLPPHPSPPLAPPRLTPPHFQAKDLRIADLRSSDPYVKIRYGVNQKFDTKVGPCVALMVVVVLLGSGDMRPCCIGMAAKRRGCLSLLSVRGSVGAHQSTKAPEPSLTPSSTH